MHRNSRVGGGLVREPYVNSMQELTKRGAKGIIKSFKSHLKFNHEVSSREISESEEKIWAKKGITVRNVALLWMAKEWGLKRKGTRCESTQLDP